MNTKTPGQEKRIDPSKAISFLVEVSPELFWQMCTNEKATDVLCDAMDDCFQKLEKVYGDGRCTHLTRGLFHFYEEKAEAVTGKEQAAKRKRLKLVQCARVTLAEQFDMLLRIKEKGDISMEVAMQGLDSAVENLGLVVDRLLEEVRYADDIHSEEE